MGLNEDLGDRENVGNASLTAARLRDAKTRPYWERFNQLNAAEDERLAVLAEECGELVQAVCKIHRHGYNSYNPDQLNHAGNRADLEAECAHVLVAIRGLVNAADIDEKNMNGEMDAKRSRLNKYLHHNKYLP